MKYRQQSMKFVGTCVGSCHHLRMNRQKCHSVSHTNHALLCNNKPKTTIMYAHARALASFIRHCEASWTGKSVPLECTPPSTTAIHVRVPFSLDTAKQAPRGSQRRILGVLQRRNGRRRRGGGGDRQSDAGGARATRGKHLQVAHGAALHVPLQRATLRAEVPYVYMCMCSLIEFLRKVESDV